MASDRRSVRFVCLHGAAKSRVAAAFLNSIAPAGWYGVSAGLEPQPELGQTAARLLNGTEAESHLDLSPPRSLNSVPDASLTVAIDCTVADAEIWHLQHQEFGPGMRDELRRRVAELVAGLARVNAGDDGKA